MNETTFAGLDRERFIQLLSGISSVKAGLIGDYCIDIYWHADMTKSELSRETPHYPLPVVRERMYPGAAGNAAANIAALKPRYIKACSVIGDDWRGLMLKRELAARGIDMSGIITLPGRFTNAYCKPMRKGISNVEYEDPRIDFANYEPLPKHAEEQIIDWLDENAAELDVLCVSDQFQYGVVTAAVREKICSLSKQGLLTVVDSRYRIGLYHDVFLKPNEVEGWRAAYSNDGFLGAALPEFYKAASLLASKQNSRVLMTLGANGSVYSDGESIIKIPAHKVEGEIDICGAGDTFLSAFACVLAQQTLPEQAAFVAGLASEVTIKKIGVTGTATREELLERFDQIIRAK